MIPEQPPRRITLSDAHPLAQLLAGMPVHLVNLETVTSEYRGIVDAVVNANGEGRMGAFQRVIADRPDREALEQAILAVDPTKVPSTEAPAEPRYRFLSAERMKTLPPPVPVVRDFLFRDTVAAFTGAHATFKTFAALDLVLSIPADLPYLGRAVTPGHTVYIAGEGTAGLGMRIRAWEQERGQPAPDTCHFLTEVPQLTDQRDLADLLSAIALLPAKPVLVVIDTLARAMVGKEENSSRDMGLLVAAADAIRRATGACVLFLHHVNRIAGQIRGHTSLPGGLDTIVKFEREGQGSLVAVSCEKQKDISEFESFTLVRTIVLLPTGQTSVVLDRADASATAIATAEVRTLTVLKESFGQLGATDTQWQEMAEAGGVPRRTYYMDKKRLVDLRLVVADREGRGARFWPRDEAPEALVQGAKSVQVSAPAPSPSVGARCNHSLSDCTLHLADCDSGTDAEPSSLAGTNGSEDEGVPW